MASAVLKTNSTNGTNTNVNINQTNGQTPVGLASQGIGFGNQQNNQTQTNQQQQSYNLNAPDITSIMRQSVNYINNVDSATLDYITKLKDVLGKILPEEVLYHEVYDNPFTELIIQKSTGKTIALQFSGCTIKTPQNIWGNNNSNKDTSALVEKVTTTFLNHIKVLNDSNDPENQKLAGQMHLINNWIIHPADYGKYPVCADMIRQEFQYATYFGNKTINELISGYVSVNREPNTNISLKYGITKDMSIVKQVVNMLYPHAALPPMDMGFVIYRCIDEYSNGTHHYDEMPLVAVTAYVKMSDISDGKLYIPNVVISSILSPVNSDVITLIALYFAASIFINEGEWINAVTQSVDDPKKSFKNIGNVIPDSTNTKPFVLFKENIDSFLQDYCVPKMMYNPMMYNNNPRSWVKMMIECPYGLYHFSGYEKFINENMKTIHNGSYRECDKVVYDLLCVLNNTNNDVETYSNYSAKDVADKNLVAPVIPKLISNTVNAHFGVYMDKNNGISDSRNLDYLGLVARGIDFTNKSVRNLMLAHRDSMEEINLLNALSVDVENLYIKVDAVIDENVLMQLSNFVQVNFGKLIEYKSNNQNYATYNPSWMYGNNIGPSNFGAFTIPSNTNYFNNGNMNPFNR